MSGVKEFRPARGRTPGSLLGITRYLGSFVSSQAPGQTPLRMPAMNRQRVKEAAREEEEVQ